MAPLADVLPTPYQAPRAGASARARLARQVFADLASPFAPRAPIRTPVAWLDDAPARPNRRRRNAVAAHRRTSRPADVGYEEWAAGAAVRAPESDGRLPVAVEPTPIARRAVVAAPADPILARAAGQLEAVAARVRTGVLRPMGLTETTTEAGMLAATLAALLAGAP